ncbi:phage head-tail joining protein [Aurantimonas sp. A3-2-R12]|uniref:phage head-tail joining protein n=1 Tax=Aurantimonas sp. A3-2-R12 TaxID=3114362 RepID=UPI002E18F248|nr:hypothetical protein [Aurantimonas sp. A3-2-R12]
MAVSLADLVAWRDALFEARLQGVRRVRDQNGEEVEYRSDREMAAALAAADAAIAGKRPSTILFKTSKGL